MANLDARDEARDPGAVEGRLAPATGPGDSEGSQGSQGSHFCLDEDPVDRDPVLALAGLPENFTKFPHPNPVLPWYYHVLGTKKRNHHGGILYEACSSKKHSGLFLRGSVNSAL